MRQEDADVNIVILRLALVCIFLAPAVFSLLLSGETRSKFNYETVKQVYPKCSISVGCHRLWINTPVCGKGVYKLGDRVLLTLIALDCQGHKIHHLDVQWFATKHGNSIPLTACRNQIECEVPEKYLKSKDNEIYTTEILLPGEEPIQLSTHLKILGLIPQNIKGLMHEPDGGDRFTNTIPKQIENGESNRLALLKRALDSSDKDEDSFRVDKAKNNVTKNELKSININFNANSPSDAENISKVLADSRETLNTLNQLILDLQKHDHIVDKSSNRKEDVDIDQSIIVPRPPLVFYNIKAKPAHRPIINSRLNHNRKDLERQKKIKLKQGKPLTIKKLNDFDVYNAEVVTNNTNDKEAEGTTNSSFSNAILKNTNKTDLFSAPTLKTDIAANGSHNTSSFKRFTNGVSSFLKSLTSGSFFKPKHPVNTIVVNKTEELDTMNISSVVDTGGELSATDGELSADKIIDKTTEQLPETSANRSTETTEDILNFDAINEAIHGNQNGDNDTFNSEGNGQSRNDEITFPIMDEPVQNVESLNSRNDKVPNPSLAKNLRIVSYVNSGKDQDSGPIFTQKAESVTSLKPVDKTKTKDELIYNDEEEAIQMMDPRSNSKFIKLSDYLKHRSRSEEDTRNNQMGLTAGAGGIGVTSNEENEASNMPSKPGPATGEDVFGVTIKEESEPGPATGEDKVGVTVNNESGASNIPSKAGLATGEDGIGVTFNDESEASSIPDKAGITTEEGEIGVTISYESKQDPATGEDELGVNVYKESEPGPAREEGEFGDTINDDAAGKARPVIGEDGLGVTFNEKSRAVNSTGKAWPATGDGEFGDTIDGDAAGKAKPAIGEGGHGVTINKGDEATAKQSGRITSKDVGVVGGKKEYDEAEKSSDPDDEPLNIRLITEHRISVSNPKSKSSTRTKTYSNSEKKVEENEPEMIIDPDISARDMDSTNGGFVIQNKMKHLKNVNLPSQTIYEIEDGRDSDRVYVPSQARHEAEDGRDSDSVNLPTHTRNGIEMTNINLPSNTRREIEDGRDSDTVNLPSYARHGTEDGPDSDKTQGKYELKKASEIHDAKFKLSKGKLLRNRLKHRLRLKLAKLRAKLKKELQKLRLRKANFHLKEAKRRYHKLQRAKQWLRRLKNIRSRTSWMSPDLLDSRTEQAAVEDSQIPLTNIKEYENFQINPTLNPMGEFGLYSNIRLPLKARYLSDHPEPKLKQAEDRFFYKRIDNDVSSLMKQLGGKRNYKVNDDIKTTLSTIEGNIYRILAHSMHVSSQQGLNLQQRVHNATYWAVLQAVNNSCADWLPAGDKIGSFSSWEAWGHCSVNCGHGGYQLRTRKCSTKQCLGTVWDVRQCSKKSMCSASWMSWSSWGPCSRKCNLGYTIQTRVCITHSNKTQCSGPAVRMKTCILKPCKKPNYWSSWTTWSTCSVTCGRGSQLRRRSCLKKNNGRARPVCKGKSLETRICVHSSCSGGNGVIIDRIKRDKSLALICDKPGNNKNTLVTWRTPHGLIVTPQTRSKRFRVSQSYLVIKHIRDTDRGLYRCSVYDSVSVTNLNDCRVNHCLNGGQCIQKTHVDTSASSFICLCTKGYAGDTCSQGVGLRSIHIAGIILVVISLTTAKILAVYFCYYRLKKSVTTKKEKDGEKKDNFFKRFFWGKKPVESEMEEINTVNNDESKTKDETVALETYEERDVTKTEVENVAMETDETRKETETKGNNVGLETNVIKTSGRGDNEMDILCNETEKLLEAMENLDIEYLRQQLNLRNLQNNPQLVDNILEICDDKSPSSKRTDGDLSATVDDSKTLNCETYLNDEGANQNTSHKPSDSIANLYKEGEDYRLKYVCFRSPRSSDSKKSYQATPYHRAPIHDDLSESYSYTDSHPSTTILRGEDGSDPSSSAEVLDYFQMKFQSNQPDASLLRDDATNYVCLLNPKVPETKVTREQTEDTKLEPTDYRLKSARFHTPRSSDSKISDQATPYYRAPIHDDLSESYSYTDSHPSTTILRGEDGSGKSSSVEDLDYCQMKFQSNQPDASLLSDDATNYVCLSNPNVPETKVASEQTGDPKPGPKDEVIEQGDPVAPTSIRKSRSELYCHKHKCHMEVLNEHCSEDFLSSCSHGLKSREVSQEIFTECCTEDHDRIIDVVSGYMLGVTNENDKETSDSKPDALIEAERDFEVISNADPQLLSRNQTISTPKKMSISATKDKKDKIETSVNGFSVVSQSMDSSLQANPDLDSNSFFGKNTPPSLNSPKKDQSSITDPSESYEGFIKYINQSNSLALSDDNYTFSPNNGLSEHELESQHKDNDEIILNKSTEDTSSVLTNAARLANNMVFTRSGVATPSFSDGHAMFPISEELSEELNEDVGLPDATTTPEFKSPYPSVTEFESTVETDYQSVQSALEFHSPYGSRHWINNRNRADSPKNSRSTSYSSVTGDDTVRSSFQEKNGQVEELPSALEFYSPYGSRHWTNNRNRADSSKNSRSTSYSSVTGDDTVRSSFQEKNDQVEELPSALEFYSPYGSRHWSNSRNRPDSSVAGDDTVRSSFQEKNDHVEELFLDPVH